MHQLSQMSSFINAHMVEDKNNYIIYVNFIDQFGDILDDKHIFILCWCVFIHKPKNNFFFCSFSRILKHYCVKDVSVYIRIFIYIYMATVLMYLLQSNLCTFKPTSKGIYQ